MIIEKLQEMEERIDRIEAEMASPGVISRMEEYKKLAREHAELREVVALFREWKKVRRSWTRRTISSSRRPIQR